MMIITKETAANATKNRTVPAVPNTRATRLMEKLRDKQLRLLASYSNGRYICRVVNQDGVIVSVSSRYTLETAVAIALGNLASNAYAIAASN